MNEQLRFYSEAIRLKLAYTDALNNRDIARRAKGGTELNGARRDHSNGPKTKRYGVGADSSVSKIALTAAYRIETL